MTDHQQASPALPLESARCISIIVPDDGTDLQLMKRLLNDKGVTRACSLSLRAVGMLREARTRHGQLPEPALARLVTIIVAERDADAIFEFVCDAANIRRPGTGLVAMHRLLAATPFTLPEGIPLEPGRDDYDAGRTG